MWDTLLVVIILGVMSMFYYRNLRFDLIVDYSSYLRNAKLINLDAEDYTAKLIDGLSRDQDKDLKIELFADLKEKSAQLIQLNMALAEKINSICEKPQDFEAMSTLRLWKMRTRFIALYGDALTVKKELITLMDRVNPLIAKGLLDENLVQE